MQELTKEAPIMRLQEAVCALPQFDGFKTEHYFANGMYMRTVWRPAGVLTVGKLHKHEHFSVVLTGEVLIHVDGQAKRFCAGDVFVTAPMTKKAVYAVTDATFMTVHKLIDPDERDLDKIEAALIEPEEQVSPFDASNKLRDPELRDDRRVIGGTTV